MCECSQGCSEQPRLITLSQDPELSHFASLKILVTFQSGFSTYLGESREEGREGKRCQDEALGLARRGKVAPALTSHTADYRPVSLALSAIDVLC